MQNLIASIDPVSDQSMPEETDYPELPREAYLLTRLIKDVHRSLYHTADALLVDRGVTYVECVVLLIISSAKEGSISPSRIVEISGEKSTNVTRIADRLYEKRLIGRAASKLDRRKVALSITLKGRDLLEHMLPDLSALMELQINTLCPNEQRQLKVLLTKLFFGLSESAPPSGNTGSAPAAIPSLR